MLECLNDKVLNYGSIGMACSNYLDDVHRIKSDPYISPYLIDKDFIKKMPKVLIYIGTADPLYDDCIRYAELMSR